MKLYILAVIIILLISCSCFLNYKEGLDNAKGQTASENSMLQYQNKYFKNRKFENVAEGSAETGTVRLPGYMDKDQTKLKKTDPGAHLPESTTDKNEEKCEIINSTRNCKFLKGSRCGYCHTNKTFMYGDENGPKTNKCPKKNGVNAWVGPDDPRGVGWVCQKFKDQETCSKVKNCGGSTGAAAICGWCPSAQKGMVMKTKASGGFWTKYKDDKCDFRGKLKSGYQERRKIDKNNYRDLVKSGKKIYLYHQGQYKGEFTPTKVREYGGPTLYAYVGWRVMAYFNNHHLNSDRIGVWTGKWYTNHVMDKSNWIKPKNRVNFKWLPTGWELRGDYDVLFDTSLIHVKDCKQFKQMYPCMGPNWSTGPHTQACIQKKWKEGGCNGDVDEGVSKSGLNLHTVKKRWNSKGHGAMLSNVKTFRINTSSTDFEKAKVYTKACLGNNVGNCSSRWNKRPQACDKDMYRWSGCSKAGKLNPESNEPWSIDLENPFQKYDKNKNKQGGHQWWRAWNKVWRTRWLSDHHTRNPKQDYGKTIKYTLACRGKVPPPPWKKPCWKDFSDMCRYTLGTRLPSGNKLNFKNSSPYFRRQSWTELKRTNSEADSNQFPRMLGDWNITETTYKLPDFPYWNFTNKIIPTLKRANNNTGISWNSNFIPEMTKVPGVIYVGTRRWASQRKNLRRSGYDELWFSEHSPFSRLIKRYNLPTIRYKGVTYTRLWQSRYKAKQAEYGFEYGFPYWTFFQAAAAN